MKKENAINLDILHTHGYLNKKRIYGLIKLIAFLVLLFICFEIVYNVTKRKDSYIKTADFFKQEENFDVLFFGSSHMINTIFPMDLWNDYGIVSYNMGSYSERIVGSYYNLLLALEHTTPKLIVVDTYMLYQKDKYREENKNFVHKALDPYPLSYTKYLAIEDLFDGKNMLDNCFEYLFNFSMYHSRWNELTEEDFKITNQYEKGAESQIAVVTPNKTSEFESIETYNGKENINMKYLRKTIEYCQQNNIEILLVYNPYPATDDNIAISKYTQDIANEYNVNYINFLSMDTVNYNTDCYDANSHLNPSGARKVTDYIGRYIMENYDIPDQRENEAYSFWYEDYNEYIDLKIDNLEKNKKNLNNYLMLLYGEEDIKYEIKISSSKETEEGTTLYELLKNIDNNYSIDDTAFEENKNKTIKITTWDNRTGEEIDTVWF